MAAIPTDPQDIIRTHVKKSYAKVIYPEAWRNLPEIPDKSEIINDLDESTNSTPFKSNIPKNIIKGPWPSKAAYIGAHYQILREDATASLRKSVAEFIDFPDMDDSKDTYVYTDIHVAGMHLGRAGAAFRIEFSTNRAKKQIRWEQSKRLQQGTLVALSPQRNMFRSICKVAVVAARPIKGGLDRNPPQVDLFWGNLDDAFIDPTECYVMIEARAGYFESSRHILVAMQKLMTEQFAIPSSEIEVASDEHSFPLSKHLVGLNKDIELPNYLKSHPFLNLSSLVDQDRIPPPTHEHYAENLLRNIDNLHSTDISEDNFPPVPCTSLDSSQLKACMDMLTQRVAIVQGPPGTGKTFVSVKALQVMLESMSYDDPPIIVAVQTNHGLDQLLTHISKFEPNFLRLGGRCDKANEAIVKRTLFRLRLSTKFVAADKGMKSVNVRYKNVVNSIQMDLAPILTETFYTEEVLYREGILSKQLYESLCDEEWITSNSDSRASLASWLGVEMIQIEGTPPINMGFELEEAELEYEQRDEEELELDNPGDNDIDVLRGTWVPIKLQFTGRSSRSDHRKADKLLASCSSLYDIPVGKRGEVYRCLEHRLNKKLLAKLKERLFDYEQAVDDIKITRSDLNVQMIKHDGIKIIGCTTTGLSKYRAFLSALQPHTLLIEEAGETLEGKILAAMFESLEHLILVGDHQQLQARGTVAALEQAPYSLAVSMFERLINNGIPFTMLHQQRRMITDVRKLLCVEENPFYPRLQDHHSVWDRVNNRKPVPGMGGIDTYWFHHNWPESKDKDFSKCNVDEAQMIVGFFNYLVLNGTKPSKITILTFYNNQRKVIIRELKNHRSLREISFFHVYTVDSYQGEENDVILLSMVRSNTNLTIGFLENKNRFVVALSRARRGLYIFGNTFTLSAPETAPEGTGRKPLFLPIIDSLRSDGRFNMDGGLPITCFNHGKVTEIFEAVEWQQISGGCHDTCEMYLPCGHKCPHRCHPFSHNRVICIEACPQVLTCGHGCSEYCSEKCRCSKCEIGMNKEESVEKPIDIAWPLSLDELLGEEDRVEDVQTIEKQIEHSRGLRSKDKSRSARKSMTPSLFDTPHRYTPLRGSRPNYTPTKESIFSTEVSARRNWQQWDAKKSDEQAAKLREEQAAATPEVGPSRLVFRDKYTPVVVDESGIRRRGVLNTVIKTIQREVVEPSEPIAAILGYVKPEYSSLTDSGKSKYSQVLVPSSSISVQQAVLEEGPFEDSFSHSSEKAPVNIPAHHVHTPASTKVPDLLSSDFLNDLEELNLKFKPLVQYVGQEKNHSGNIGHLFNPNNTEKSINFSDSEDEGEGGPFTVGDLIDFH